ncbi:MAG: ABC transporter permease [Acholeplasma sp.]|jgi:simple sugar transport system permease protein|nr:MAG: ABC transporter permease [Acholeplasma sp.]
MKENTIITKITEFFKRLPKLILKGLVKAFNVSKPSLISIGVGLLIGFIIMLFFDAGDAFPALGTLLIGGFNGGLRGIGNTLYQAAPIILTGLAVAFAFRTGLFNIGASGQMMMGAYVAIHIGVLWQLPAGIHWIVGFLAGMLAGAIWGFIPGILKALSNVNEVITSIMMNYIAGNLLIIFIMGNVFNSNYSRSLNIQKSAELPLLTSVFPGSTANIGIFIAIAVVIIAHIILHKTTLGFQLRASGFSMPGSKYAGMNTKANVITAMTLSGSFAGMAGAIAFLVVGKNIGTAFEIFPQGFDGISVALLGLGEPVGALFAGLFLSNMRMGGFYMQRYSFVPQIIDMIIAVIIYVTAISASLQIIFKRYGKDFKAWRLSRKEKKGEV